MLPLPCFLDSHVRGGGRREVGVEERIMGSKLYWFQYWLYEGSKLVNLGKSARYKSNHALEVVTQYLRGKVRF